MRFEFATVPRIIFGSEPVSLLPSPLHGFGSKGILVRASSAKRGAGLVEALRRANSHVVEFAVEGEPTVPMIRDGTQRAKGNEVVVGFGGGSAIDAAKAIAALATNPGDPLDYLEVVGKGKALEAEPLPFVAIPTTAGTGAEVTRNAVISSPEHGVKASLRSPHLLAKVAIVDPMFTMDFPPEITAYTGLDALTQLIEPYTSSRANAFTDAFCLAGMRRAANSIRITYHQGQNQPAREAMSYASLLSGL